MIPLFIETPLHKKKKKKVNASSIYGQSQAWINAE
jgi:hypothetical protein